MSNTSEITEKMESERFRNAKFIRISQENGIVDEHAEKVGKNCLMYNSSGEAYFNINCILSFNIDESSNRIFITFAVTEYNEPIYADLVFPDNGGEFQRIRRELTE